VRKLFPIHTPPPVKLNILSKCTLSNNPDTLVLSFETSIALVPKQDFYVDLEMGVLLQVSEFSSLTSSFLLYAGSSILLHATTQRHGRQKSMAQMERMFSRVS
jgi:hypothetical protein